MSDYIYLLENRLSQAQRSALRQVREVARAKGLTIFLVGGAVRDLTSGSPVRDLDVVVQGSALKLKKELEKEGAIVTGEAEPAQALFLRFPGGVRMEFGSTLSVSFPKPGKPVAKPATILEDLRRRDFTANAMALSLNDGSYGLLMDPLNGVADIENRQLRLVSNYGFIEDPVRMIRAARLMARLGWTMDDKTEGRYDTGKAENYISVLSDFDRGYELEEIVHEEDSLRILKRLESEGWMKVLAPYWDSAKVNVAELERMREVQTQLQMQGIHPETAAANFPLLTAKLSAKEAAALKASFPRQGFTEQIEALDAQSREFAAQLGSKTAAKPSQAWKLFTSANPETVLWTAFSSKSPALQAKLKSFLTEWPQARLKMPYTLLQEMRIVPELPGYEELLETLFFELMDGNLSTPEEMKAFLEPFSPPAPPPPVNLRRQRAAKKESKPGKSRSRKAANADVLPEDEESSNPAVEEPSAEPQEEAVATPEIPRAKVSAAPEKPAKIPAATTPSVGKSVVKLGSASKTAPVKAAAGKAPLKSAPAPKVAVAGKQVANASAKKSAPVKVSTKSMSAKTSPAKAAASKKSPETAKKVSGKAAPVKTATGKPTGLTKAARGAPAKAARGR